MRFSELKPGMMVYLGKPDYEGWAEKNRYQENRPTFTSFPDMWDRKYAKFYGTPINIQKAHMMNDGKTREVVGKTSKGEFKIYSDSYVDDNDHAFVPFNHGKRRFGSETPFLHNPVKRNAAGRTRGTRRRHRRSRRSSVKASRG